MKENRFFGAETPRVLTAMAALLLSFGLVLAGCPMGSGGGNGGGPAVTTLAGSGDTGEDTGGYADGPGAEAKFKEPTGVAADSAGNVYVADWSNNRIRKISPDGVVTTFAGSGDRAYSDGTGEAAKFAGPNGVALDSAGNIYVADRFNHRIRKISPAGVVTTIAGSTEGYADGPVAEAKFNQPTGVTVDSAGNVYVADTGNHRIRKISSAGAVTTIAGSGTAGFADNATGTSAQFNRPFGVAVDSTGNVYVADYDNHRIRKISPAGAVSTLAGNGEQGFADGTGAAAKFSVPFGVAVDSAGNVYVADTGNNRIRKISPVGVVSTLAGSGEYGYADGSLSAAKFATPRGVAVESAGNIYVADFRNNRIRKITR
jgi:sugar lactone lactonase YvrE